jgi:hypothetical protein
MYEIQLKAKDGSWHTLTSLCDGSTQDAVTNTQCRFEMLEVINEPLLMEKDDLIVTQVRAGNKIGWGDYSDENTSGQIT